VIVIDYSQVCIAALTPFFDELGSNPSSVENLGRHAILSKIKAIRVQFKEFGELVIACDGKNYWRKDIHPNYKGLRKKAREESNIPWPEIYRVMDMVRVELAENSMYKVIRHERAEADDIMAILTLHIANKRLVEVGLEQDYQRIILITSDGDMKQLHITPNVYQYSPMHAKYVRLDKGQSAKDFLRHKIIVGDSGDCVPNVFSDINCIFDKIRQTPATAKRVNPILESANLIDGAPDDKIKARLEQNEILVSFDKIPQWLIDEIIEMYDTKPKGNRMTMFKYLAENKCRLLMDEIQQF
jgi:hypothetical protein